MKLPKKNYGVPYLLAAFLVLGMAYSWKFGRATELVWMAKKEAAKNPRLAVIPAPLPDTSISSAPGKAVSYFGYQFEAPVDVTELRVADNMAAVGPGSGKWVIAFFNPATNRGFVTTMHEELGTRFGELARVEGEDNVKSDYDFVRAILTASPSHLSLIFPSKKEVLAATFLMTKEAEMTGAETGLYSFEIGRLRGFQLGDPSRTRNVRIQAFDAGSHRFEIVFGGKPGPVCGLAQSEINRVLQSLRPAVPIQQ